MNIFISLKLYHIGKQTKAIRTQKLLLLLLTKFKRQNTKVVNDHPLIYLTFFQLEQQLIQTFIQMILYIFQVIIDSFMIRAYRNLQRYALSKSCAQSRSKQLIPAQGAYSPIRYTFNLALHAGNKYEGLAKIQFDLASQNSKQDLFLDFGGKHIHDIIINQQKCQVNQLFQKQKGRVLLPRKYIQKDNNSVCITYENQYDSDGSGCVSFIDVDQKQYLYTQFQPYMANRVFPIFDQPDLKATMDLNIACPNQWEAVLSNQSEINSNSRIENPICSLTKKILDNFTNKIPTTYKKTSFSRTKILPSYLFCFVVGPYKKYTPATTYKNIPMSYYCIQSLYPYLQKQLPFIQQMTNKSMQFFEQYFGYPYPFNKYDQIFAHQYKWGAMENAGIVTLNDLYIFKDPVSVEKMIGFGNTIVHQMAHHWFGNLVTMRWWDDLWLNQSFAQYISHFCLQKIKSKVQTINYQSAMYSFLNRKAWGYNQDQLITTHPIRSDVQNTQVAQSIFDGITYSKGAATMKQLMYLMGEKQFSNALKQYFHKYQFKNAELTDLLDIMKKYYKDRGVSVDQWREMWLEKAGLNVLSCQIQGQTDTLVMKQSAYHEKHPTLRSHTIKIALIESPKKIYSFQAVVNASQTTRIKLSSSQAQAYKKSKAVILNHEDLSFCKCIIDSTSIEYLKKHLNQIEDVLLRSMIWKNFFDMVKDAHLKATDYIEILANNLFSEKSDAVLEENLNYAVTAVQKYMPKQFRSKCRQIMLNKCIQYDKELGPNRSIVLRDKIITFSDTDIKQSIQSLISWYDDKQRNLKQRFGSPNITQKWKLVVKALSSKTLDKQQKLRLLNDMISKDSSDTMKNKKLTCDGLLLEQNQVEEYFKKITSSPAQSYSMTTFIHSIAGLNSRIHEQIWKQKLTTQYFNVIKQCLQEGSNHKLEMLKKSQFIELFIDHMDPITEDNIIDLQHKINKFRNIGVQNNDKIKIQLQKKINMLQKRIKCYQLYK